MRAVVTIGLGAALTVGACAPKTATLPTDPVDLAATCSVIAAASERGAAGAKGDLSADAQARILHYAMLSASANGTFDADRVNAVSRRSPQLFDQVIKGKWQTLRPGCAAAFPATEIDHPTLPQKPLDAMLDCSVLADFLRRTLGAQGPSFSTAALNYGVFKDKLEPKLTTALHASGLRNGPALTQAKAKALGGATGLGQPPAVMDACEKAYPA